MTLDAPNAVDVAAARSVLARLVGELFAEPDEAWAGRLADPALRAQCAAAAEALTLAPSLVADVLDRLPDADAARQLCGRVLGHTVRSECPPYELEYARGEVFQQAHALADVAAFYGAFGLEIGQGGERPDSIVAQWEFLGVCAWKQFLAEQALDNERGPNRCQGHAGQDEAVQICRDAQRAFLKDHAANWMPAFFSRLRRGDASAAGFYAAAADLGEALLRSWCAALGVPVGPDWLELRPEDPEDLSMDCGPGRGPGQIELGPGLAASLEPGDGSVVQSSALPAQTRGLHYADTSIESPLGPGDGT